MARPSKSQKTASEVVEKKTETPVEKKTEVIPENVDKLMKLYPQYEEIYITPEGFVHPKATAPAYAIKNAVLYKNKYYKP